jgi:hypothetical protein
MRRSAPVATHVCKLDAVWPEQAEVEPLRVTSPRSSEFLTIATNTLDELNARLPPFTWRGIDLKEAIIWDWFVKCSSQLHRAYTLRTLANKFGPSYGHWASTERIPKRALAGISDNHAIKLKWHACLSPIGYGLRTLKNDIKTRLWRLREEWQASRFAARNPVGRPAQRRVIFAEFFTNSARLSLHIAKAMERTDACTAGFLSARRQVHDAIHRQIEPCWVLCQFMKPFAASENNEFRKQSREFLAAAGAVDVQWPSTSDCSGLIPRSLVLDLAESALPLLRTAAQQVNALLRMCDALNPLGLVTTTFSSTFGRALALAGRSRGVPCIYVQHGILGNHVTLKYFLNSSILVWGTADGRAITNAGIQPERITVVGAAHHDRFINSGPSQPRPWASAVQQGLRVLFLASRAGGAVVSAAVHESMLVALMREVLAVPEASLTVKVHPSDHTNIANKVLSGVPRAYVTDSGDSMEHLRACDVAVVTSSTTGLEACVAGKPLLILDFTKLPELVDYDKYGAALKATNEAELHSVMRALIGDPAVHEALRQGRGRLLEDRLAGSDGEATARTVEAIRCSTESSGRNESDRVLAFGSSPIGTLEDFSG